MWLGLIPIASQKPSSIVPNKPRPPVTSIPQVDPYDDPIYAIQEAKVAAKKARDAERAEAAAAKREKEAQLKVLQFSAKLKNKNLSRTDPAAAHGAAAKKK